MPPTPSCAHAHTHMHRHTLLNKQNLLNITFTVYKPVYWYVVFDCCWCCSGPPLAVFYRTEACSREAGTPSMQHPVSHLCVGGEARGSSPLLWKSRKLMTADTLPGGPTARVFAFPVRCLCECVCLREREGEPGCKRASFFLLLWHAPDCSCHLHLSHKGLMGRWTWQEGGTPICLVSDVAEWLYKHLSITVRVGRELQCSWICGLYGLIILNKGLGPVGFMVAGLKCVIWDTNNLSCFAVLI